MTAFYRILTAVYLVHSSLSTQAADTDSTATRGIHGSANTEVNYGYESGKAKPTIWDFPHITLSAAAVLGRGWSVTAEVEYERFYTDGAWGNSFRDNFTTNKLYLNKSFSPAMQVKAGIVEVPVGVTNSGGPALTIYDPESEVLLMPMTWHEGGLTLWGERGRWSYSLAALAYAATPLRRSRLLGGAARVAYSPVQDLSLALSSYWGTASRGSARLYAPDFVGTDGILYAALDGSYEANGWTVSGSAVWSSAWRQATMCLLQRPRRARNSPSSAASTASTCLIPWPSTNTPWGLTSCLGARSYSRQSTHCATRAGLELPAR